MDDNKRQTRSSKYQHILLESVYSHNMMEAFSNEESIYNRLNPFKYSEEMMELEDELKTEFWKIVDGLLTKRQRDVINLYCDGYTQMEIAKMLNVNQSSITKSLNGNVDYSKNKPRRSYGGSLLKIKKIIEMDENIQAILLKMRTLRDNQW